VQIQKFDDLLARGNLLEDTLFLSRVNVPTRKFDEGLIRGDGWALLNATGEVLMENFGMELEAELVLNPDDEPGYYELAILGDDGHALEITPEGHPGKKVVDHDKVTATRMTCSHKLVRLEQGK